MGGSCELIDPSSEVGEILRKIKIFARKFIYSNRAAEQVELAGRSVVSGLLDHFGQLIQLSEDDFLALVNEDGKVVKSRGLDFHLRLYRRLPKSYRDKYLVSSRGADDLRRAHLIVDFISGMTDDFALETYQILSGIKVK